VNFENCRPEKEKKNLALIALAVVENPTGADVPNLHWQIA
jgi:hypothetical protein